MHTPRFQTIQTQTQTQVFTPQLRQSLEILQVSALELRDVLLKELQSNPVLEELPLESIGLNPSTINHPSVIPKGFDFEEKKSNGEWEDYSDRSYDKYSSEDAIRHQHFLDSAIIEKSLQEHIIEQAKLSECTPEEFRAIEFLVGSLDDKGFLTAAVEELVESSNFSKEIIINALKLLKSFDPIGIGSKDVQECLLVQLQAEGKDNSLVANIVKDHFPLLLRRRIPELVKKLGVSIDDIQTALNIIATLDPNPGRRFQEDHNRSVVADAFVEKVSDEWMVTLNNEFIPKMKLSSLYKELMAKGQLNFKEKEYIQDKMRSGKFILNAIEQRQKTIERITYGILKFQKDFFEKGLSFLHPLTMKEMGDYLSLHETTISRAIANKYLNTPHGLFAYKYFFTSGYDLTNGELMSNTSIKNEIAKIIQEEPNNKPYSDQKITEILLERNLKLSRRTVAKYREEMSILATSLRRKY